MVDYNYSYPFAFVWGLAVLVAFIGYGRLVFQIAGWDREERAAWGLAAAIGMASVLALGGVMLLLGVATRNVLVAMVWIGVFSAVYFEATKPRPKKKPKSQRLHFADLPLWVLAFVCYATAVHWPHNIDINDDIMCYLAMPERIAQTGTLDEPFNIRRSYSLGGHMFNKALVQSVTSERTGHLVDMGISKLILFGVVLWRCRPLADQAPLLRFALAALVLLFPVPRINTHSALSGVCLLLPAMLLFGDYFRGLKRPGQAAIQIGLLLSGALTLRPTFLGLPLLACAAFALWDLLANQQWKTPKGFLKLHGSPWVICLGFLASWMVLSWIVCQTPFYPLMLGNVNDLFNKVGSKEGFWVDLATALSFQFRPEMIVLLLPGLIPLLTRVSPFAAACSLGLVGSSVYIALKTGVAVPMDVYRFVFPSTFVGTLFFLFEAACIAPSQHDTSPSEARVNARYAAAGGIGLIALVHFQAATNFLVESVASLHPQVVKPGPFLSPSYRDEYRTLQNLTPRGAPILLAVDAPYLVDYQRNPLYNIDSIGGASPPPGMPLFKGPQELKRYLQKLGIRYILAVEWDKGLVYLTRKHWLEHKRPEWFWKELHGPHALDFMDSVDALQGSEKVLGTGSKHRLIELQP
jgi:hypothetical protein